MSENKPILNIAFHGFWDTDAIIYEHYFKNSHRFLWKKWDVNLVSDPALADVLFCSVFGQGNLPITQAAKILLIHENIPPQAAWFDAFDYVISFALNMTHRPNHFRIPYWAYRFYEHDLTLDSLQNRAHNKAPTPGNIKYNRRFCNFVYSNPFAFRREFAHTLSAYRLVDFGGKVDTNIPDHERAEITPSLLGSAGLKQKTDWLNKYKFTITFENSSTEGYTTEKILDAFVGNSVPLYWGNLRIKQDGFNPKAFLNYFDSLRNEIFIQRIKEVDESPQQYLDMVSEPVFLNPPDYINADYMVKLYDDMINRRIAKVFNHAPR